eukprot:CAMPEP_0201673736 /NCGR_PEP_ID=MMETSP0494-20130426/35403_1 /ASSEMBLY_ACC=CAM_ASM_000839 /TAXON_ID=420259 /ORGANISM="Thalassiosira gravida, Strain GMp14c1" /LENGTH=69 /DNA_ID=CAMNT_0048155725 /DNA_START=80 /DNA_END=286 /DNA_ORIENTATION=+
MRTCLQTNESIGYTKNIVVHSKPLATLAALCMSLPGKSKKLLSMSPSVSSKKARYPARPHAISSITQRE